MNVAEGHGPDMWFQNGKPLIYRFGLCESHAGTNAVVSGTQYSAYDTMGRVLQSSQNTNGSSAYPFAYTYNLGGGLETETYPSTRKVTTCYDAAGRVSAVSGTNTPSSSVTNYTGSGGVTYAPHGAIQSTGQGNHLTETWTYNKRLQPTSISVGTSTAPRSVFGTDLFYCPNQLPGQLSGCASNNGNLIGATLPALGSAAQQTFSYDPFNRLQTATETPDGSSTTWTQTYGYDLYANRWVASSPQFALPSFTPTSASNFNANNQLIVQSSTYDAAGNQKLIGGLGFVSDAENRLVLSTGDTGTTQYGYDGDGRRVWKSGQFGTTTYVYDAMGALAAEYGGSGVQAPCNTCYLSVDHLGSTRAMADGATGLAVERHDYLPFGEDLNPGVGVRTVALKYRNANDPEDLTQRFTGKERDTETAGSGMPDGLDYFGARYYSGAQGRFTSPDPWLAGARPGNPQTWNRYSYTLNNPLRFTDPTGMEEKEQVTSTFTPLCASGVSDGNGGCDVALPSSAQATLSQVYTNTSGLTEAKTWIQAGGLSLMAGTGVGAVLTLAPAATVTTLAGAGGLAAAGATAGSSQGQQLVNTVLNIGGTVADAAPGQIILQTGKVGDFATALSNASEITAQTGNQVVLGMGNAIPFANGQVNQIIVNNVPIGFGRSQMFGPWISPIEMQRILAPGGIVTGTSSGAFYTFLQGAGH